MENGVLVSNDMAVELGLGVASLRKRRALSAEPRLIHTHDATLISTRRSAHPLPGHM